jgi:hypothetical protein
VFCLMLLLLLMMMILLARLAGYYLHLSDTKSVCVRRGRRGTDLESEREREFAGGRHWSLLRSAVIDIWWQC